MVSETTNLGGDWDNLGGGKQIPTKNSLVGGSDLGGGPISSWWEKADLHQHSLVEGSDLGGGPISSW